MPTASQMQTVFWAVLTIALLNQMPVTRDLISGRNGFFG